MIDMHHHGLSGVDDGCADSAESLVLLKSEASQGVSDVICTPHFILDGKYHLDGESVLKQVSELQEACNHAGIELVLHAGHELFIHRFLPGCLKEKQCLTLAGSRYVLVEFPFDEYQDEYDYILEDLRAMGYIVIVAHPERYAYVRKDLNFCLRWLDCGDLLQCNQNSILNKDLKKMMHKMLKHGFVSFIASDAHGSKRPCRLSEAYEEVVKLCGKQKADELFVLNQVKILKNEIIENDDVLPIKKFFGIF